LGSKKVSDLSSARRAIRILGVVLAAWTTGACSRHPARIDAWPLFYHEEIADRKTTEILWPVGGSTDTPRYSEAGAWPIVTVRKDKDPAREESSVQAIYPFFNHRAGTFARQTWLLPFFLRTSKKWADEPRDIDNTIFPLFFWGTKSPRDKYFAFFPIYGTIRNRLARDEIFFVLFPIYSRSKLEGHTANNVLFPLIAWTYGGNRRSSRVLPFYTYLHVEGEPELWSVLWPIVHFSKSTGEERTPRSLFYIFPLFGWDNSFRLRKWTVLWPFFSGWTKPGTDYYRWVGPWPFVRFQKDKDLLRRQFWPFYGYFRRSKGTTQYILWPLYRQFYKETEKSKQTEWDILYIFRNKVYRDKQNNVQDVRRMYWPFFRYFRKADGSKHFHVFSPLWYWDERGFERNYSRFWRIFEYVKDPATDETSWRVVWRLIRYDRIKDYRTFNFLGPLFRYEREPERLTRFSILSGLLTVGSRGGSAVFKLFYIPFAGGADTPEAEIAAD